MRAKTKPASRSRTTVANPRTGATEGDAPDEPAPADPREDLHRGIVAFLSREFGRTGERACVLLDLLFVQVGSRRESIQTWEPEAVVGENCRIEDIQALAVDIVHLAEHLAELNSDDDSVDEVHHYELRTDQLSGGRSRHAFRILPETSPRDDAEVRHPFVLRIEASGVHVDVRVEGTRSLTRISRAISEGLGDALRPLMPAITQKLSEVGAAASGGWPASPSGSIDPGSIDLVSVTSRILSGEHTPDDAQLDMILDLLRAERERRAESRS